MQELRKTNYKHIEDIDIEKNKEQFKDKVFANSYSLETYLLILECGGNKILGMYKIVDKNSSTKYARIKEETKQKRQEKIVKYLEKSGNKALIIFENVRGKKEFRTVSIQENHVDAINIY